MADTRTAWQRLRDGDGTPKEVAAAQVLGALDERGELNDIGVSALAAEYACLSHNHMQRWELGWLLYELRDNTDSDVGVTVWFDCSDITQLLTLLEDAYHKYRIDAAGWQWCDGPYGVSGLDPVGIAPCGSFVWEVFPTLEAAAEYAEAHNLRTGGI